MGEHVSLYVSPINLDPEQPAMPISHPSYYAGYLARRHGAFATLGLAEDTWALNEGVTDDATFLQQAHDIDDERRTMCLSALDQLRRGTLVCVFDATDRIQHMFWRYLDATHPAHRADVPEPHKHAIRELYQQERSRWSARCWPSCGPNDVLMVLSDHGFSAFRRGVNLNAWLHREGYLALRPGRDGSAEWLRDVDWSRTRAYCVGLGGMYLNVTRPRAGRRGRRRAPRRRPSRPRSSASCTACATPSGPRSASAKPSTRRRSTAVRTWRTRPT